MITMKYRLLFKNKLTDEVAVVVVDVPDFIKDFQLVGSAKTVSVYDPVTIESDTAPNSREVKKPDVIGSTKPATNNLFNADNATPIKFDSGVAGTARLSTYKGQIVISRRRGTNARNQSSPTSICINDHVKQQFFDETRNEPTQFRLYKKDNPDLFNKWFNYIETEYKRQLNAHKV